MSKRAAATEPHDFGVWDPSEKMMRLYLTRFEARRLARAISQQTKCPAFIFVENHFSTASLEGLCGWGPHELVDSGSLADWRPLSDSADEIIPLACRYPDEFGEEVHPEQTGPNERTLTFAFQGKILTIVLGDITFGEMGSDPNIAHICVV